MILLRLTHPKTGETQVLVVERGQRHINSQGETFTLEFPYSPTLHDFFLDLIQTSMVHAVFRHDLEPPRAYEISLTEIGFATHSNNLVVHWRVMYSKQRDGEHAYHPWV